MRTSRVALVAAIIAHALAWAVLVFLLFVTAYEGESVQATLPGEQPAEAVRTTETFVGANGLSGVVALLAPVVMTAIALIGLLALRERQPLRMAALWAPFIATLALCLAAIFTIGLLYVPVAAALFVAALADFVHRPVEA